MKLKYIEFSELLNKSFSNVYHAKTGDYEGQDELHFINDSEHYVQLHQQDCCEGVYLDDIAGDLNDLVNSPILLAEEINSEPPTVEREYEPDSETWTFYKLSTIKGSVTIRWYGSSNGCYSETAELYKVL
jgi:hypothetical protein